MRVLSGELGESSAQNWDRGGCELGSPRVIPCEKVNAEQNKQGQPKPRPTNRLQPRLDQGC